MFALDIIALIFAVVVLAKVAALIVSPKPFIQWGLSLLEHHMKLVHIIYLLGILIVGYYVFTSVPVHVIAAVFLLSAFVYEYSFISYEKQTIAFAKDLARKPQELAKRSWFVLSILVIFAVWTLLAVLV